MAIEADAVEPGRARYRARQRSSTNLACPSSGCGVALETIRDEDIPCSIPGDIGRTIEVLSPAATRHCRRRRPASRRSNRAASAACCLPTGHAGAAPRPAPKTVAVRERYSAAPRVVATAIAPGPSSRPRLLRGPRLTSGAAGPQPGPLPWQVPPFSATRVTRPHVGRSTVSRGRRPKRHHTLRLSGSNFAAMFAVLRSTVQVIVVLRDRCEPPGRRQNA